jgi:hypothetical protein
MAGFLQDAWKPIAEVGATLPGPFLQDWMHLLHLGLQRCAQNFNQPKIHNRQDGNNQKLWRVTMEYRKEDLMEAKKQILGVGENMGTEESKKIWEENAQFWDNAMGDESNEFHREVVRPKVTELLSPNPADYIWLC